MHGRRNPQIVIDRLPVRRDDLFMEESVSEETNNRGHEAAY
jgi:hypothetical protein